MASVATQAPVEVPSSDRVEPGSFPLAIANFPAGDTHPPTDANGIATQWVESFNKVISSDLSGITDLFLTESYWRDQLCLSWDFHTLEGPQKIISLLSKSKSGPRIKALTLDKSSQLRSPTASVADAEGKTHTVQAFLTIETDVGHGAGLVRLVQDHNVWKVFTLFTFLKELKGHEESVGKKRPNGVQHGEHTSRKNWLDLRNAENSFEDGQEPTVLILGVIDLWLQVGDSIADFPRRWTGRYHSSSTTQYARHQILNRRPRRTSRRQLANSIPSIGPTRPRLVRPPTLPSFPRKLANIYTERQAGRLVRILCEADGAQCMDSDEHYKVFLG
jgi:hypothetical protein